MATSRDPMPSGWGYSPSDGGKVAPPRDVPAEQVRRSNGPSDGGKVTPPRDVPAEQVRRSRRQRVSNDRRMHMRFALWASRLNRKPMPGETADAMGVCYETARRLIWDWEKLNKESP